jgi:YidC/Oxa1 family membrane protein insertase
MINFFTVVFYQPILNLLIFLYNTAAIKDLGLAIILLTLIIKAVFWPLGRSAIKSQKALQDLQPKMEALKKQYGDNKAELSRATMELYKNNQVNPFSSCLPLLIQLPFLFAVYRVLRDATLNNLGLIYTFINRPEHINTIAFGFLDLAKANYVLAILAGLAQFLQAKMMITTKPPINTPGSKDESMAAIMNKQMLYFMPALTVFIGLSLPGGLTLYWFVLTAVTAIQQYTTFRKKTEVVGPGETIEGQVIK